MALADETRLGPCEILSPIGAGGVREVYRVKDTRLDRTVTRDVRPFADRVRGNFEVRD